MPTASSVGPGPGPTRRVLVVDDDELLREVAKAALELVGGWQVTTSHSGAEAHAQAVASPPDAILLDVMMPGLDGPATVAALAAHKATRDIPIIFLTAKRTGEDSSSSWQDLGLAGVIAKPFDPVDLVEVISRLAVEGRRAEGDQ